MNRLVFVLAFVMFVSLATLSYAQPPLSTEFYGNVTVYGGNASIGSVVTALYANNQSECGTFTVQNTGHFGLLTCKGDDTETNVVEGASQTEEIIFRYNGFAASQVGNSTWDEGEFKFIHIIYPPIVCGDDYCQPIYESVITCPLDCNETGTNQTQGNNTGNETGTNQTQGNQTQGGEGGTGPSSGGGGGGGGGGGSGGSGAYSGLVTYTSEPCVESWECSEWEPAICPIEELQNRTCYDLNACGTEDAKPPETKECIYEPTCFDGVQNGGELGIDCGGNCLPCPGCSNGRQDIGEEGIDCGGPCRPCNSCFDGELNYGEEEIDCGGPYCKSCRKPFLELPTFICNKNPNPLTNGAQWFFLLLLIGFLIQCYYSWKRMAAVRRKEKDEVKRAKKVFALKRKIYSYLMIMIAINGIFYYWYYVFFLCEADYSYLVILAILLVVLPILIALIIKWLQYDEKKKIRKLIRVYKTHYDEIQKLIDIENNQLMELESELSEKLHTLIQEKEINEISVELPHLRTIYRYMISIYDTYKKRKNPYGLERELCKEVYLLETNEHFKELAQKLPVIKQIYGKLKILYAHYESKQQLYDQLTVLEKQEEDPFESTEQPERDALKQKNTSQTMTKEAKTNVGAGREVEESSKKTKMKNGERQT